MKTMKSKYFIYHIPGVKIGVSNNPEFRVVKQQGFTEYEILEEHTNAKEVSKRERILQAQYGYPVDKIEYWKTLRWQKKGAAPEARKKAIANTDYSFAKTNKFSQLTYTPESQAKRVANTDYQEFQARKVANTNWEARTAKIDYKALSIKRVANTNFEEIMKKRVTDYKAKAEKCKKPVNQYDLQGNFLKRWDSATDVANILHISSTGVTGCCKQRLKKHKNYIWEYAR